MAEQRGEQLSDQRRPHVELRFLPSDGSEARPGTTGGGPAGEQPVAGRWAEATPARGSRLVGRKTIARLRGGSPAVGGEPVRRPPSSDAGRVVLVYEQVRRPWRLLMFTAMLVSLTVGVVLGQTEAYRAGKSRPVAAAPSVAAPSVVSPVPLTAPLGAPGQRRLEITGAVTTLRIRTAPLGESSYSITGFDPGIPPRVAEAGGGSVLTLSPEAVVTPGAEVVLNSAASWTVKLTGGATDLDVDARAGGLATIESVSAVSRGVLQLAKPKGSAPLTITGPVGDLTVRTEVGALVRIRVAKGAALATIGGTTRRDVANGATLRETGWRTAPAKYDIRIAARVNTILVERLRPDGSSAAVPAPSGSAVR
ncbi:hypothetical protein Ait01nite_016930 [Actinoplanes italicus]|uniref:Uncharacterized protein n=1 Tax=Actinoplanes italicus TaxID=113567 RepID=A0A2T0JZB7_9ACTN|nr:hypothetical protein [Actinoplanes italicus]PRX15850.1 hypothetical protein CLV67_12290 [Actinoplanes italicus]GIE28648.1 hypothetical protein Ait01nite_016930 [Actinoplanes italicus]